MYIILLIVLGLVLLNMFPKLLTLVLQLAIVTIGYSFHPFIGMFILVAYILDWLGITKKKDAKQEEYKERSRTNFYKEKDFYNKYREQERAYRESEERKRKYQEYEEKQRRQQEQQRQKTYQQRTTNGFFAGCTTKEQLKKRHRELCKKYHPDKGGDPEVFKKMQAEYDRIKIRFQ